mgnify:CR=1 FL=1
MTRRLGAKLGGGAVTRRLGAKVGGGAVTRRAGPWRAIVDSTLHGAVLVVIGLAIFGCLSPRLPQEELPERPIAFLHWEDRDGQKRGEVFAKAAEAGRPPATDSADPEREQQLEIEAWLRGDMTPQLIPPLAKYPGRLMLLWPRTGELTQVEAAPRDALPLAWSGDGRTLLLASSHRGRREQLYEYDLDRDELRPVTVGPGEHARGDYLADGRLLIHRSERRGRVGASEQTLHLSDRTGRIGPALAERVPPGSVRVLGAGEAVVYEQVVPRPRSNGPTAYESWVAIRPLSPGAEERLLLKGREPVLTPDGEWIVFASNSTAGYRLRRMRPDGTSRVAIGPGGSEERMPAVSPDGEFIVFVQSASGRRRLVVRRFDGKDERVVLSSGWSEFPVW